MINLKPKAGEDGFKPNDTVTTFMSYETIKRKYIHAKGSFRIAKADYEMCRSWCHTGGGWPKKTGAAKERMHKRARVCRHWQVLYENLRARRQNALVDPT